MKNKPKNIKELLRSFKHYKVSADLDAQILKSLDNMRVEGEVMDYKPSFFTLLRGYFKSFNRYVAIPLAMLLVFIGGGIYHTQTSYTYHLNKAKSALVELESEIKGNSYQVYIIPRAMAANGVNDDLIAELTGKVVSSTEKAIEIAERIGNPQKLQLAFVEINKVQEKEVEVLINAVEVVKSEKVAEVVAKALENTAMQEESVDKVVETARKAIKEKRKEIKVDIKTSKDQKKPSAISRKLSVEKLKSERLKKANEQYENAKKTIEKLKSADISKENLGRANAKLNSAAKALKDGKIGRVHGLTTAIQVKNRNILRQVQLKKVLIEKKENKDEVGTINRNIKEKTEEALNAKEMERARQIIQKKKEREQEQQRLERLKSKMQDVKEDNKSTGIINEVLDRKSLQLKPDDDNLTPKTNSDSSYSNEKVILDQAKDSQSDGGTSGAEMEDGTLNRSVDDKSDDASSFDGRVENLGRTAGTTTGGEVSPEPTPETSTETQKEIYPNLEYKAPADTVESPRFEKEVIDPIELKSFQIR